MSKLPKVANKKVLIFDCFGTISNRHYLWYTLEVYAYRLGLIKQLNVIEPRVVPLLRELKQYYTLVFLTNSYHPWMYRGIKAQGIEDLFEYIIISSEVRMRKPRKKIFNHTLKTINREAKDCTLVDNARGNNRVAKKLGLKVMPFTSQEDLYQQLTKLVAKHKKIK